MLGGPTARGSFRRFGCQAPRGVRGPRGIEYSLSPKRTSKIPPLGWALALLFALVQLSTVTLLAFQLSDISASRSHIEALDRQAVMAREAADPLLRASRPLLRESGPIARESGSLISDARELARSADALVAPLSRSPGGVGDAVAALPAIERSGRALLAEAQPVLGQLASEDLGAAVSNLSMIASSLLADSRLVRLIRVATATLERVNSRELIAKGARAARVTPRLKRLLQRALGIQLESLRTQKSSLSTQRRSLRVLLDSRSIQRQSLRHVRSLDRKTGGTFGGASSR